MTKIEWTARPGTKGETWNPVTGCTKISPGCKHCYAERMSKRLRGRCGYPKDNPFQVTLHPDKLDQPLRWKSPRTVFVCSMGDLFHDEVFDLCISKSPCSKESVYAYIFDVVECCPQHTFLFLTKRPENMALALSPDYWGTWLHKGLPNVWLGVTAENQEQVDKRVPVLLQTPAALRFVSVEPMLGPVSFGIDLGVSLKGGKVWREGPKPFIDWVICGGESGHGARPLDLAWIQSLRDQCQATGTPFFFKQRLDDKGKKISLPELDGKVWAEWPEGERI